MTSRSMSLSARSPPFATEPYTKAARIRRDRDPKAVRIGSARPTVFMTMPRSSENNGDVGVRLVVFLLADAASGDEPAALQSRQLPLRRSRPGSCPADEFRGVEAPVRLAEQQAEHALLRPGEQRVGQASPPCPTVSSCRSYPMWVRSYPLGHARRRRLRLAIVHVYPLAPRWALELHRTRISRASIR